MKQYDKELWESQSAYRFVGGYGISQELTKVPMNYGFTIGKTYYRIESIDWYDGRHEPDSCFINDDGECMYENLDCFEIIKVDSLES